MKVHTYDTLQDKETKHPVLVCEKSVEYNSCQKFDQPEHIAALLNDLFSLKDRTEEYVYMLAFNSKFGLLGVFEISHGTVNTSILNPREVFMKAVLCGAATIVLAHNHPSGDLTPSALDLESAQCIKQAGELMGLPLADNMIISNEGYLSFMKEKLL